MTYLQKIWKCPIFHANSSEEQKKGHHDHRCVIFQAKSSEEQKKGHHVCRCPIFHAKLSKEQQKVIFSRKNKRAKKRSSRLQKNKN